MFKSIIMRFINCLNMTFNLTKPIGPLIRLHDFTWETVVDLTDHFADALVCKNVACVFEVVAML